MNRILLIVLFSSFIIAAYAENYSAYLNKGITEFKENNYELSFDNFIKAYDASSSKSEKAKVYIYFFKIFNEINNYSKAKENLDKAIELYIDDDNEDGALYSINLGLIHFANKGHYSEATVYAETYQNYVQSCLGTARKYIVQSLINIELGEYTYAERDAFNALDFYKKTENYYQVANSFDRLTEIKMLKTGYHDRMLVDSSIKYFKKVDSYYNLFICYQNLYTEYKENKYLDSIKNIAEFLNDDSQLSFFFKANIENFDNPYINNLFQKKKNSISFNQLANIYLELADNNYINSNYQLANKYYKKSSDYSYQAMTKSRNKSLELLNANITLIGKINKFEKEIYNKNIIITSLALLVFFLFILIYLKWRKRKILKSIEMSKVDQENDGVTSLAKLKRTFVSTKEIHTKQNLAIVLFNFKKIIGGTQE